MAIKQLNNSYAQSTYVQWGSDYLPDIWQNSQTFLIPNIGLSHPEMNTRPGARIKLQSDTVVWSPLIMDILIDRDFLIYEKIYENFINHLNVENGKFADTSFDMWCSVMGHDGTELCKWTFHNCRVEDVSEINVEIMNLDEPLKVTLTMAFDYMSYKIIK